MLKQVRNYWNLRIFSSLKHGTVSRVNNLYRYIPGLSLNIAGLVDSLSRGPDQIQMYPDRDAIPQLFTAPDVLLRLF